MRSMLHPSKVTLDRAGSGKTAGTTMEVGPGVALAGGPWGAVQKHASGWKPGLRLSGAWRGRHRPGLGGRGTGPGCGQCGLQH